MCAPMRIPGTWIAVTIPGPVRQTIHTSTKAVLVLVINGETRERFELWRVVVGSRDDDPWTLLRLLFVSVD